MENSDVTLLDASNQLVLKMQEQDLKIEGYFDKIASETDVLVTNSSTQVKFDAIVSIEYLLVKARLELEFESVKVKRFLESQSTPPSLRSIFLKRDQSLAKTLLKLNNIRDDISVLQKVVYTKSSFNFK